MVPSSTQVAAKRSPILGYNHNVKYRGLIFHVQTEDSGLLSPHLFTHLFYGGVILSTRKLVYDAGAAEDAIKGLMQAQHKVVLKDLKGGKFDDKIDQYLAGTEGLLPREAIHGEVATPTPFPAAPHEIPRASDPALAVRVSDPEIQVLRPETDHDVHPEILGDDVPAAPAIARTATPPPVPTRAQTPPPVAARAATPSTPSSAAPTQSRTQTADRKSAPSKIRTSLPSSPPPAQDLDPPTLTDSPESIAAAIAQANANATIPMEMPQMDSGVQIQLELDDDDDDAPRAGSYSDGIPGAIGASASAPNVIPERPRTGDRASLGAATLPPARPVTRPPSRQAISPPAVMSRPLTQDDRRDDAVEVYAPAPPSIDAPPGAAPVERPGQYVQHRRVSEKIPMDVIRGEGRDRTSTGSVPIPAGLARPGRPSQNPPSTAHASPVPNRITREPSSGQPMRAASQSSPPSDVSPSGRARRATPARVSTSNPAPSRTGSGGSSGSGGVVMTRPAVIVGAPAKPAPQRVRKAREEEGRGFGQGLISEKSLDEVILAYLSEDADEK